MKPRRTFLLLLITPLTLSPTACRHAQSPQSEQPDVMVRKLYTEATARHPNDIPQGPDWKTFAPYFSNALLKRFDQAKACAADWNNHNPDPELTASIAPIFDIFFGGADIPQSFEVGKVEPQKDGSLKVYVSLTKPYPNGSSVWRVATILRQENGHFSLDDIIYLDDSQWDHEEDRRNRWLSHYLAAGCDGPRWIGSLLPKDPADLAQSLYANVMAHPTSGIPSGEDWKIFAPYLGLSLLHKIDNYNACIADEERQYAAYKGPALKLSTLDEFGIFSGGDEEEAPRTLEIEKIDPQKDGTVRVNVKLGIPQDQWEWLVVDVFTQENSRFVLKDIVFPDLYFHKGKKDDRPRGPDGYLSKNLTEFCNGGTHWTGGF
jgi:hypothetical protein